jgi:hypothetical protein
VTLNLFVCFIEDHYVRIFEKPKGDRASGIRVQVQDRAALTPIPDVVAWCMSLARRRWRFYSNDFSAIVGQHHARFGRCNACAKLKHSDAGEGAAAL